MTREVKIAIEAVISAATMNLGVSGVAQKYVVERLNCRKQQVNAMETIIKDMVNLSIPFFQKARNLQKYSTNHSAKRAVQNFCHDIDYSKPESNSNRTFIVKLENPCSLFTGFPGATFLEERDEYGFYQERHEQRTWDTFGIIQLYKYFLESSHFKEFKDSNPHTKNGICLRYFTDFKCPCVCYPQVKYFVDVSLSKLEYLSLGLFKSLTYNIAIKRLCNNLNVQSIKN